MQELKKNQHLQEYIRLLENRMHQTERNGTSDGHLLHRTAKPPVDERSTSGLCVSAGVKSGRRPSGIGAESEMNAAREVQDLKEQLEALRCQVSG